MNRIMKIVGYGVLIWLIPFLVSVLIFPIKTYANPLFESIMPLVITITVIMFGVAYFKGISENFFKEGIFIGAAWFFLSIVIDLLLFMPPSPMQMGFVNYMMDIGITYFIIPAITIGIGYIIQNKSNE
jgi:hypothetical protein